jgi:hypothetical protein
MSVSAVSTRFRSHYKLVSPLGPAWLATFPTAAPPNNFLDRATWVVIRDVPSPYRKSCSMISQRFL